MSPFWMCVEKGFGIAAATAVGVALKGLGAHICAWLGRNVGSWAAFLFVGILAFLFLGVLFTSLCLHGAL